MQQNVRWIGFFLVYLKDNSFHVISFWFFFSFSAQSQLNIHLKSSHEEAKTEICEYCAKRYVTKYLLRIHTENVHSKDPPKREKVQCNVCNAWFSFKNQLKSHMGTHTDPVKCDICQKLFKNQNSLYQHKLRFHTVTKAIFKCHLCPKTFLMTSSLQVMQGFYFNMQKSKT